MHSLPWNGHSPMNRCRMCVIVCVTLSRTLYIKDGDNGLHRECQYDNIRSVTWS